MKTFAWLARASCYVLLAISFGCGDGGQLRDAGVRLDAAWSDAAELRPDSSSDVSESQVAIAPDVADLRTELAPDVPDASLLGDGANDTTNDGASIVDGSDDVDDGGARTCWYEKARTGPALPSFDFSFVAPDRVTYACSADPRKDAGPPWPRDLRGVVTGVSASQFTLDTCVAQDACDSNVYTFMVNAPGLALNLPIGHRVRVQWQIAVPRGCTSWLQVSDDTSDTSGTVWLVGNHGFQKPPFELPFDVTLEQLLGCRHPADAQASCSGALTGDYAFRFSSKLGPASTLALGTTENARFTFQDAAGVARTLDMHCLQAFQTVMCDDYWRWNFWALSSAATTVPLDAAVDL